MWLKNLQQAVEKQEQQRKRSLKSHLQQRHAGSGNAGAAADGSSMARAEAMQKELLAEEEAAEAAKLADRIKKEAKKKAASKKKATSRVAPQPEEATASLAEESRADGRAEDEGAGSTGQEIDTFVGATAEQQDGFHRMLEQMAAESQQPSAPGTAPAATLTAPPLPPEEAAPAVLAPGEASPPQQTGALPELSSRRLSHASRPHREPALPAKPRPQPEPVRSAQLRSAALLPNPALTAMLRVPVVVAFSAARSPEESPSLPLAVAQADGRSNVEAAEEEEEELSLALLEVGKAAFAGRHLLLMWLTDVFSVSLCHDMNTDDGGFHYEGQRAGLRPRHLESWPCPSGKGCIWRPWRRVCHAGSGRSSSGSSGGGSSTMGIAAECQ